MAEVDLLSYTVTWYADHVESARHRGVSLTLGKAHADRPTASVWITARRGDHEAQLILWASGEAEFAAGTPENPTANEHHDVDAVDHLNILLDRLLSELGDEPS